jgi:putative nucleotidyltransferase with HDIG domain
MHAKYIISESTRQRCDIIQLTPELGKRFLPVSLELFHYLYEVDTIDFSIYFRVGNEMIHFIKPKEFSHELVDQVVKSSQKEYANLDICVTKKEYPSYQATLQKIRQKKITQLLANDPSLDRTTLEQFSNLSNASQMIIKGGIDRQVAWYAKERASYLVTNLMGSDVAIGTLSRMVLADPTLYDHSASVAMMAAVIARRILHKTEKEAGLIALSGLYHDVGKTCVPNHILNKPAKLTREEFEVIKEHTSLGYEELQKAIAQGAPIEETVARVALEHHERFDGHGYPQGLQGRYEEHDQGIHEFSRVVMIADVYSALLMKRVYKEPFDPEKAIGIMQQSAVNDYDPIIFEPFCSSVSSAVEYYRSHEHDTTHTGGRIILIDEDHHQPIKKSS